MNLCGDKITLNYIDLKTINLDEYLGWLRDVENNKYISSSSISYSRLQLVEYIKSKNSDPKVLFLGIFIKNEGTFIGTIKLEPINTIEKSAWLGIMIGNTQNLGKGFGYEAIKLILIYAKNTLMLKSIFLGVHPNNTPAIKLYRKIGFRYDKNQLNKMTLSLANFQQNM